MAYSERMQVNIPVFKTEDDLSIISRIIRNRCGETKARVLARRLITKFTDIGKILSAEPDELKTVSGICDDIAEEIALLRDIAFALARRPLEETDVLDNCGAVFSYLRMLLTNEKREQFHVLYLNKNFRLINHKCHQIGTVDHVTVYPREVMRHALSCHACSIILVHNHPSGNVLPSQDDFNITARLVQIGEFLGITVCDHIIVAGGQHYSFTQEGVMPSGI
ncbi:MAG: JAB domain-containing protein [Rhizobiaceae bacterium]